jgi:hypothetical protein
VWDVGDGKSAITFTHPTQRTTRFVLTIERAKGVVVEARWLGDEPTGTTKFSEFTKVADTWWPTQVDVVDETGRVTSSTRYVVETLAADAFAKRIDAELVPRAQLIELGPPPADLDTAKQHSKDGKATLEDRLLLLADAARRGESDEAKRLYGDFAAPLAGRFGLVRIELQLELITRRHEGAPGACSLEPDCWSGTPTTAASLARPLNLTSPLNSGEEVPAPRAPSRSTGTAPTAATTC